MCKVEWDGKSYVGEKAITTSDSYRKGKRRSTNQGVADGVAEGEEEDD